MTILPFDRPGPTGLTTAPSTAMVEDDGDGPPPARAGARHVADTVACATPGLLPTVADVAAVYVAGLPWACRLITDDAERQRRFHRLTAALSEYALAHGHVDLIGRRSAAIWLDRTVAIPVAAPVYRRLMAVCGPHSTPVTDQLAAATRQQVHGPHLYLALLATVSREDALALLAHRHLRLDRAGVSARADASTPGEAAVLGAAGYQIDQPFRSLDGIRRWPMLRLPAGRRSHPQPRIWPPDAG